MLTYNNFSYGATSAIMSSLAIIISLSTIANAKASIIVALLVVAIADNVTDTFAIHLHQESQTSSARIVRRVTYGNFSVRLVLTLLLIGIVMILPLPWAIAASILFGVLTILLLSYFISVQRKYDPVRMVLQHLLLAGAVLAGSFILRDAITALGGAVVH